MSSSIKTRRDELICHVCWYEPAKLSFVALGDGREVRLFSLSNPSDGTISHVADFDFDSDVLTVHVCALSKGVIVTSVSCTGVGWSWIDGHALSVEKTEFQEILYDGLDGGTGKIPCAAVAYVELFNRFVLSFGSNLFLTSEVDRFACELVVQSPLAALTGLAWGGKGVLLCNLQQYGVEGVQKWDSDRPQHECLITRVLRTGDADSSLLLECEHHKNQYKCLRWCELECEDDKGGGKTSSNVVAPSTRESPGQKEREGALLRVLWELPLQEGSSVAVEPYNNDGQDSRKLVYVATALGGIHIFNVNGPVCSYQLDLAQLTKPTVKLPSPRSAFKEEKENDAVLNVTGLMLRELPLGYEKRRHAVLSLSNGCYVSVQMDVVAVEESDEIGASVKNRLAHMTKVTARPAHSLLQDWDEEECAVRGDVDTLLPYAHEMVPLHSDPAGDGDADANVVLVLARCWGQGRQLLRMALPNLEDTSRRTAGLRNVSKSKSKLMQRLALCSGDGSSDTSKDFVSGMASQLQVLQPRAHYLCGPLDAVAPVSRVLPVSNCTYNTGLPATIFATSQPHYLSVFRSSPPMQSSGVEELKDDSSGGSVISTRVNSTATALYTCQYGLPVDTSACAHLPVQADVAPGMQLLAPNYAYVGGGGSGSASSGDGARPLLITSRVAHTTNLVMLDPVHAQLFMAQPEDPQEQSENATQLEDVPVDGGDCPAPVAEVDKATEEGESLYPSYLQVSTDEFTVALVPLSADYALQVMPSCVRLVQLRATPALKLGEAYQRLVELSALGCGTSVDNSPSTAAGEGDTDMALKADNDEEDGVKWEFEEEESDEEGEVANKSTDRKKKRGEAILEFQRVEAELHQRQADRIVARDNALRQAAAMAQVNASSPWTVTHTASLGPFVALFGGRAVCILGLDVSVDEDVAAAAAPESLKPVELLASFTLPDDVSSAGGMLWRGKHVLAVGYWTLSLLQLYSFEVGDRELILVNSLYLPSASHTGDASHLTLSHIALLPLYFSHDLHVDDIAAEQPTEEEEELDLMAALESMDQQENSEVEAADTTAVADAVASLVDAVENAAAAAADASVTNAPAKSAAPTSTTEALIGLLGCVAASHTGEIFIYHAVMRLEPTGTVQKWDLHLHQRIPLMNQVRDMTVVDEDRADGSLDYCRALLVSGDKGSFVLSFAQAHAGNEATKSEEGEYEGVVCDGDDPRELSVPGKQGVGTGLPVAAMPFLRNSVAPNNESDPKSDPLHLDTRRLAKRVALSSPGSVPLRNAFHSISETIGPDSGRVGEDSLPSAISEYRWGVWPLVSPASATRGTTLVQLPRTVAPSPIADDTGSQQRLSVLPLSVLSALRLGWLEVTDESESSQGHAEGEGRLDLKIGGVLPSLKYHVQKSVTVPGTIKDIVASGDHVLVRWSDTVSHGRGGWGASQATHTPSKGHETRTEGLCLLDTQSLRTQWLHSSDIAGDRTGRVEACLEGLPPLVWGQTHLYAHSSLPALPTLTMVHRRSKEGHKEDARARLSVFGVAPEASLPIKPSTDRVLVALGGMSVKGVHLLHSVVSRQDQESKLIVTASEDTVQVIGWQRSKHASCGPDSEEDKEPAQALATASTQRLSLDKLGMFAHSWGNLLALATIYGGPSTFTVVISRALVGLELLSVTIDSSSPERVTAHMEPQRCIHFPKCFPMITSIAASRLFAKVKPSKGHCNTKRGVKIPNEEKQGVSSHRPWWHGWRVLPQQGAEEERKMSLLFESLSLPEVLACPMSLPFASLRCTDSASKSGPREYLISLGCGEGEQAVQGAGAGWVPPLLQRGGDAPEAPPVVEDDDEEEKKPRRVIFAAGTKIYIDPLKGSDVLAAASRVVLERDRREVEAQERTIQFSRIKGGTVQVCRRVDSPCEESCSYSYCLPPQISGEAPTWLSVGSDLTLKLHVHE